MKWIVEALVLPVRLWQLLVSSWMPPVCRFHPSCSHYMIEALRTHGPVKGLWLGTKRIVRCNPLFEGGLDPVPPRLCEVEHGD
ncbi:MAG: membrane protein insertion efficiency factor YidD [Proteobacteria bacterium]|nr:membrane protein insertion efficiency factor YidD [Pseudomonadota bacterium]MCP4917108.1 membrane protein insertion efficiency factor YidD [Pseudomonadota bacterium]